MPTLTPTEVIGAPQWITLPSDSPDDIRAAVEQGQLLLLDCPSGADCQQNTGHLGTPTLVTELRAPAARPASDIYIIPMLSDSGQVVALVSAELNAEHTALRVAGISSGGNIGPSWPRVVAADAAIEIVRAQHQAEPRPGIAPRLVWLLLDAAALKIGKAVWNAGGRGPQDPVWLIARADGKDHIVGTDGRAYYLDQIPLEQG